MNEQSAILVRTKLNIPTINHKIIKREKLLKKLQQSTDYKLTLITAPAGFGKTTAAASYLMETGIPYAWLSLDENDNDPVRFWRYLFAAFRGMGNFSRSFWEIPVRQELINSNIQADMLLDKLDTLPGKTVLVLDDLHLIDNEIIHHSLTYFFKYLPSHFRMIILSRKEPELKIIREYTSGRVLKLDFQDLAFDAREVAEFFKTKGYPLTPEAVSALRDYTEGWAAGLVMAAISMAEEGDATASVSRFSQKNRHVDQLFQEEVFDRWPERVKDFLERIAFLDKFCGPLCRAVTGVEDSTEYLKKLAESNSFIFQLDRENEWFRFHHLFRDFLRNRLERRAPAFQRKLCRKAAEWYRDNELMQEAIEAFIKTGVYEQAFSLLVKIYLGMVEEGEFTAWLGWMNSIPPKYYEEAVTVCVACSWLSTMEKRFEEARVWVDKAQSCFERIRDGLAAAEKDLLEAHVWVAKANLAFHEMNMEMVTYYFKQADRLQLSRHINIGEMNSGEVSFLKTAYGFRGRLKKFDGLDTILVDEFPRLFGKFSAYFTIGLAESHYERNQLQTASIILTRGMEDVIELGTPGAIVLWVIALARLKRAAGDIDGAMQTIAMGRQKLVGRNKTFWNHFLDVFIAGLYIDRHDASSAAEWLNIDRIGILDDLSCSREYEHLIFTRYLNLTGRYDDALLLLNRLDNFAKKEDRLGSRIEILCRIAVTHQLKGELAEAMAALDGALVLGMEDGYLRTFIDELGPMMELLAKYKNWQKKPGTDARCGYAKKLLRLARENNRIFRSRLPDADEVSLQPVVEDPQLSVKEYRVLRLLAAKRSNREIAAELCVTVRTVKYYNSQIFEKLGVDNRTEAVARAWEMGMLE